MTASSYVYIAWYHLQSIFAYITSFVLILITSHRAAETGTSVLILKPRGDELFSQGHKQS